MWARPELQGCWLLPCFRGPVSPCDKTFPGDNGLQREDNEGCLQLDLGRQVHCLGCMAVLSGTCVASEPEPLYQEHTWPCQGHL